MTIHRLKAMPGKWLRHSLRQFSTCLRSRKTRPPRCYGVSETTWFPVDLGHSFVWLKLSYSPIDETSFRLLGGSRFEASSVDLRKCQTAAAPRQSRGNSHFRLGTNPRADMNVSEPSPASEQGTRGKA